MGRCKKPEPEPIITYDETPRTIMLDGVERVVKSTTYMDYGKGGVTTVQVLEPERKATPEEIQKNRFALNIALKAWGFRAVWPDEE